jgi:hypothetical protein
MDPGRPKKQISKNQTKLVPLCLSRRADFDHIIVSSNIHRMRNLSHSNQNSK